MSNISNLNSSDGRSSALATFLLSKAEFKDREYIFTLLRECKLFSEFDKLVQAGSFVSREYLLSSLQFPFSITNISITLNDALVAFNKEKNYRQKRNLVSNINVFTADIENVSLEEIKDKCVGILDREKSASVYDADWSAKKDYIKDSKMPNVYAPSGIRVYDHDIGGFRVGNLHAVIGFAGAGKSTFGLNIAYRSILARKNVLLISSEISRSVIQYQMLSLHSYAEGVNLGHGEGAVRWLDIMNARLGEMDTSFLFDKVEPDLKDTTHRGRFMVADTDSVDTYTNFNLQNFCKNLPVQPDIIIIDYFQRLPFKAASRNERAFEQQEVVKELTKFANGGEGYPPRAVILLSQANRSGYKEAKLSGGAYDLTAIFETSQIEKDACLVLSVFNSKELSEMGKVRVSMQKNRLGKCFFESLEIPVDFKYGVLGDLVRAPENMNTSFDIKEIYDA